MLRRIVFIAHGAITLAAAVVLAVAPGLIPSTVGIVLRPGAELLPTSLPAASSGSGISLGAATLTHARSIRLIAAGFAAVHLVTGILEVVALVNGADPFLWGNVAGASLPLGRGHRVTPLAASRVPRKLAASHPFLHQGVPLPTIVVEVMPGGTARPGRQGRRRGAASRGRSTVSDVRIGKRFELTVDGEVTDAVLAQAQKLADEMLSNSVIEDVVKISVLEGTVA